MAMPGEAAKPGSTDTSVVSAGVTAAVMAGNTAAASQAVYGPMVVKAQAAAATAGAKAGADYAAAQGPAQVAAMGALGYLVKPVDVRQIVPAVRAALSRSGDEKTAQPSKPSSEAARDELVAIGILMERLRLDDARALEALQAQAKAEGKQVAELATNMVEAANRLNSIRH